MFKLNLKIAWRNILKNKGTNFIKLFGLVIGLTAVFLLTLYLRHELSYDKYNPQYKQLFRIHTQDQHNKVNFRIPEGISKLIQENIAEVEEQVSLSIYSAEVLQEEIAFPITIAKTQAPFFNMFGLKLLESIGDKLFTKPNTGVLTESLAKKLFPSENAIGKVVTLKRDSNPIEIVGIVADIPSNTHFTADIILNDPEVKPVSFGIFSRVSQYILLQKETDLPSFEQKFKSLSLKHNFPENLKFNFFPVADIHLKSHTDSEFKENNDIKYIYIFSVATVLILLIAIINYVNLTIASSLKRAKEIGLKKVLGSSLSQLRVQFLLESYIYFLVAAICSFAISYDLFPALSIQFGIDGILSQLLSFDLLIVGLIIFLLVGFLAGFYPAVVLSRLQPISILKSNLAPKIGGVKLKRALLFVQFGISALLIICALIINGQINFIRTKDVGVDRDHVLHFACYGLKERQSSFKNELLEYKEIKSISTSSFDIASHFGGMATWQDQKDTTKNHRVDFVESDPEFIKTIGAEMAEGTFFQADNPSHLTIMPDYGTVSYDEYYRLHTNLPMVLNESAVKAWELTDPVGKVLNFDGLIGRVIGVVKDFNAMSLHTPITPIAMKYSEGNSYMYVNIGSSDLIFVRKVLTETWKKYSIDPVPEFKLIADTLDGLYVAETRLAKLILIFSIVAISLCCIGLYGMIYFELQQRTKEIAIRRILGGSRLDLLKLLNRGYVFIIVLANIFVWPIAYIFLDNWLSTFYYRTNFSYMPFLLTTTLCITIAVVTICIKAISVIKQAPVSSLKHE